MNQSKRSSTLDWTAEDEYWRMNYRNRPYAGTSDYDFWQPAYRYGYDSARQYPKKKWQEVEATCGRAGISMNTATMTTQPGSR